MKTALEKYINKFEYLDLTDDIYIKSGSVPVLISAPHVLKLHVNGESKPREPYTKAISLILHEYCKTHVFINNTDLLSTEIYTKNLVKYIRDNNIKLVLDIHGAKNTRKFNVDIGTLDGTTAKETTVENLLRAFQEVQIPNITINSKFKGGPVTKEIYKSSLSEVMQLEINANYRLNFDNLKKVIDALIIFIDNY